MIFVDVLDFLCPKFWGLKFLPFFFQRGPKLWGLEISPPKKNFVFCGCGNSKFSTRKNRGRKGSPTLLFNSSELNEAGKPPNHRPTWTLAGLHVRVYLYILHSNTAYVCTCKYIYINIARAMPRLIHISYIMYFISFRIIIVYCLHISNTIDSLIYSLRFLKLCFFLETCWQLSWTRGFPICRVSSVPTTSDLIQ